MLLTSLFRSRYARRSLCAGLADAACFLAAAAAAWVLLAPPFSAQAYAIGAVVGAALASAALIYCDAYGTRVLGSSLQTLRTVTMAMGLAFASALGIYFLAEVPPGFVPTAAHIAALFFPLVLLERAALRRVWSRLTERVVVIGAGQLGAAVARVLHERPNMGLGLVGFLSDDDALQGKSIEGYPVLGRVLEVEKLVADRKIERILVASQDRDESFPAEQLLDAKLRGCRIDSGLVFLEHTLGQIFLPHLRPSYLIFSDGFQGSSGVLAEAAKRAFDLLLAGALLLLVSPVLALAALAIRLDTPGPVFYRQERVGQNGRRFRVVKLRTMRDRAEDTTGAVFASRDDTRITRVGRILRRTRLDEVPQLWNVLVGEMSLVGPRPERPEFVELLSQRYPLFRLRSAVKPGVTGWAQIRYGYVNDIEAFAQKLSLDLFYLKHRSFAMDLLILWATVKTVVLFRGL